MLWNQENEVRVIQRRLGLQHPGGRGLLQRPPPPRPRRLGPERRGRRPPDAAPTGNRCRRPQHGARPWAHEPHLRARSARSPSRPPSPSTPRPRRCRRAGDDVIGFGAGEPDFPTPAHIVEAAVAACRDPRNHKYTPTPGLPELRAAIAAKTAARLGLRRVAPQQVLVTNGGKHAVYNAFQTLLDPGDEVILPAPYWTTYPEAVKLADGVPVELPTTEADGFRVTVEQLEAARTPRTKVLRVRVAEQPHRRGVPGGRGRGDRAVGRRARRLGAHRRDLRAPHLRRPRVLVDAGGRPRAGRHVRRAQRRRQDLRDDGVARRLDDRPARLHRGRGQPAVAPDVERGQRRASAPRSRRSVGDLDAVAEMRAAFDRTRPRDARAARRDPRRHLPRAARARSTASRRSRACSAASSRVARRPRRSSSAS